MQLSNYRNSGFTILELMITVILITALVAILLPLIAHLLGLIRLNLAIFSLSQQWKITRYDATGNGQNPLTLCMTQGDKVVHFAQIQGNNCQSVTRWRSLPRGVSIDTDNSTLRTVAGVAGNTGNIYRVSWADTRAGMGASWGQLGRLVLIADGTIAKRCLFLFSTDGSWDVREDQKCDRR